MDCKYASAVGINSLIREAAQPHDVAELAAVCRRWSAVTSPIAGSAQWPEASGATSATPLEFRVPRALLFDCTHDNDAPAERRTAADALSTAALVSATPCSIGSTKGFDVLQRRRVDIVTDQRPYALGVSRTAGLLAARRVLNTLHGDLGAKGFSEVAVEQCGNIVTVVRLNPLTLERYFVCALTAFRNGSHSSSSSSPPPLALDASLTQNAEVVYAASLEFFDPAQGDKADATVIGPTDGVRLWHGGALAGPAPAATSPPSAASARWTEVAEFARYDADGAQVHFGTRFSPGAVIIVHSRAPPAAVQAAARARGVGRALLPTTDHCGDEGAHDAASAFDVNAWHAAFATLSLVDLNALLYRCDAEERGSTSGAGGVYVTDSGPLVYCGVRGFLAPLQAATRRSGNGGGGKGDALVGSLRRGEWAVRYTLDRLRDDRSMSQALRTLATHTLQPLVNDVLSLPALLRPAYFHLLLQCIDVAASRRLEALLSLSEQPSLRAPASADADTSIVRALRCALGHGVAQMYGDVRSTPLLQRDVPSPSPSLAAGVRFECALRLFFAFAV